MGIELEWFTLLVIAISGEILFGRFEFGTALWKRFLKWGIVLSMTYGIYVVAGHWALAFILLLSAFGLSVHFVWCRRHGIHPLRATPRWKYYELRGWHEVDE